jgi:dynein intermediate chain 2
MLDISFHYKTKRTDFGRPYNICEEVPPRLLVTVEPEPEKQAKYCAIHPFSLGVQASVSYSQHSVNTEVTQTKLEDVVHKEGGWPQGVDPTNAPSCKQTRLKLEKRENFIPKLKELAATVEKTGKLNVAIDLFSSDFPPTDVTTDVADPQIRTLSIFRDRYVNRSVSSISWSADSSSVKRVALCYTPKELSAPTAHYESFIYNLECPSVPELELHPHSALYCLEYNTKDPNYLVGGMAHGSLSLWDVRQGSLPVWTSAIESSHRDAVYAARWISAKTAFECVSVSADGNSMTWDTRSNTTPLEVIPLTPEPLPEGFQPPFGGRCLDYHTGVPTKYMVGTVEGLVMSVNRKAADPTNRISAVFPCHYGPVYAVRRHPTETKYFCSISDWCCRMFTEDNKTPLVTIPAQRYYLTNAVWGYGRTTVVYTANVQGTLDAWDLIQSLKRPICSISVGHVPVYSMAAEGSGQFLLTGDADGTATLLEFNEPLRNISASEKTLFNGMMGREAKRVKNYDQFLKEQKMREKKATVGGGEDEAAKKPVKEFDPAAIESEFDAALRGEAEKVVEKKRVVIGGDEEQQLPPASAQPIVVPDVIGDGLQPEDTSVPGVAEKIADGVADAAKPAPAPAPVPDVIAAAAVPEKKDEPEPVPDVIAETLPAKAGEPPVEAVADVIGETVTEKPAEGAAEGEAVAPVGDVIAEAIPDKPPEPGETVADVVGEALAGSARSAGGEGSKPVTPVGDVIGDAIPEPAPPGEALPDVVGETVTAEEREATPEGEKPVTPVGDVIGDAIPEPAPPGEALPDVLSGSLAQGSGRQPSPKPTTPIGDVIGDAIPPPVEDPPLDGAKLDVLGGALAGGGGEAAAPDAAVQELSGKLNLLDNALG